MARFCESSPAECECNTCNKFLDIRSIANRQENGKG